MISTTLSYETPTAPADGHGDGKREDPTACRYTFSALSTRRELCIGYAPAAITQAVVDRLRPTDRLLLQQGLRPLRGLRSAH